MKTPDQLTLEENVKAQQELARIQITVRDCFTAACKSGRVTSTGGYIELRRDDLNTYQIHAIENYFREQGWRAKYSPSVYPNGKESEYTPPQFTLTPLKNPTPVLPDIHALPPLHFMG